MRLLCVIIMFVMASPASAQKRWTMLEKPTTRNLLKAFFVDTVQGWVVGDSGTILKTTNGGTSWLAQDSEISNDVHGLFMLNQFYGWALAFQYPQDTLWYGTIMLRTTNGGMTWIRQDYPEDFYYAVSFHDSMNGWLAGDRGKLRRTTDGGLTWSPVLVDSSLFSTFPIRNLSFFSRNYGYGLGGHMDIAGVIWRTTDGGQRWAATGVSGEPVNGMHYIDSVNHLAVVGDFDGGSSIVRTKDGGRSWDYTYLGIWGDARTLSFRTPSEGWSPLGYPGTYMVTMDTGRTWNDFYSPDSSAVFDVKFIDSTHGFMVGGNGTILKYDASIVGVDGHEMELPVAHKLYQNYPNPFNPSTTIVYELTEASFVTVRFYDVAGRELKTLLRGNQGPGMHEVEFDGDGFSSGTYFYELATTNSKHRTSQVRKMILLR